MILIIESLNLWIWVLRTVLRFIWFLLISVALFHWHIFLCIKLTFSYFMPFMILRICNPGQSIWQKVRKYSKIGQDLKNVISNFACFWQLLSTFNFWKGDWALGCVSTQIWHFYNFLKVSSRSATLSATRVPSLLC